MAPSSSNSSRGPPLSTTRRRRRRRQRLCAPPEETTDQRTFTCTVCSREFHRLLHLQRHEYIHSDKKPFQCPWCSKSFTRQDSLVRHARLHVTDGDKKAVSLSLHKHKACMNCTEKGQCERCAAYNRRLLKRKSTSDSSSSTPPPSSSASANSRDRRSASASTTRTSASVKQPTTSPCKKRKLSKDVVDSPPSQPSSESSPWASPALTPATAVAAVEEEAQDQVQDETETGIDTDTEDASPSPEPGLSLRPEEKSPALSISSSSVHPHNGDRRYSPSDAFAVPRTPELLSHSPRTRHSFSSERSLSTTGSFTSATAVVEATDTDFPPTPLAPTISLTAPVDLMDVRSAFRPANTTRFPSGYGPHAMELSEPAVSPLTAPSVQTLAPWECTYGGSLSSSYFDPRALLHSSTSSTTTNASSLAPVAVHTGSYPAPAMPGVQDQLLDILRACEVMEQSLRMPQHPSNHYLASLSSTGANLSTSGSTAATTSPLYHSARFPEPGNAAMSPTSLPNFPASTSTSSSARGLSFVPAGSYAHATNDPTLTVAAVSHLP